MFLPFACVRVFGLVYLLLLLCFFILISIFLGPFLSLIFSSQATAINVFIPFLLLVVIVVVGCCFSYCCCCVCLSSTLSRNFQRLARLSAASRRSDPLSRLSCLHTWRRYCKAAACPFRLFHSCLFSSPSSKKEKKEKKRKEKKGNSKNNPSTRNLPL